MNKYILHITSADNLGLAFLSDVVAAANMGAVLQEGTLPSLRFPQIATMVLEAETHPTPKASLRVFDYETKVEIKAAPVTPVAATFSLEEEGNEGDGETNTSDLPEGFVAMSAEELAELPFDPEFRAEVAKLGIKGKKRELMTKQYLAKVAK